MDVMVLPASIQDPPQVIRVGDKVMITNPEFVVRVGYPMSYADAFSYIERHHVGDIQQFINEKLYKMTEKESAFSAEWVASPASDKDFRQIMRGMAKLYLNSQGHGGKERTIHTESRPERQGQIFKVLGKKVCKTGTYDPPWAEQDYNGEWDNGPGGLLNCKTHVLLELQCFEMFSGAGKGFEFGSWIESKNVKKLV